MMDAILFSANPHIVDIDDVAKHLSNHETLYWTVGFPFSKATKETLSFPIYGFIHVSGHGQVEYRTLVHDIVPFSPSHFANPSLKPAPWREEYKANPNERPLKSSLVMTEIVQFSFDTYQFEKYGGGLIKRPPQRYVRVISPNQPQAPEQQSRVAIAESNLESFVVDQLDTIETGL